MLRGSFSDSYSTLPPNPCGPPPAHIAAPHIVYDWTADLRHPVGAIAYPAVASRRGEQGTSMVTVCILPDGWVADVVPKHSSGSDQLDAVTLAPAGLWHFLPAPGGINNVPEWADLGVRFNMPPVSPQALPPHL